MQQAERVVGEAVVGTVVELPLVAKSGGLLDQEELLKVLEGEEIIGVLTEGERIELTQIRRDYADRRHGQHTLGHMLSTEVFKARRTIFLVEVRCRIAFERGVDPESFGAIDVRKGWVVVKSRFH